MATYEAREIEVTINGEKVQGLTTDPNFEAGPALTKAQIVVQVAETLGLDPRKVLRDLRRAQALNDRNARAKSDLDERRAQGPNRHERRALASR